MLTKLPRPMSLVLLVFACALQLFAASNLPAVELLADESKVTKANADKIKAGMMVKEVEEILGPGKEMQLTEFPTGRTRIQQRSYLRVKQVLDKGGKAYKWEDGKKAIILVFANSKVTITQTRNLGNDDPADPEKK